MGIANDRTLERFKKNELAFIDILSDCFTKLFCAEGAVKKKANMSIIIFVLEILKKRAADIAVLCKRL